MTIRTIDIHIIHFFRRYAEPMARWAIFIVYGWFGLLKLVGFSPANPLVRDLLSRTIPFVSPDIFIVMLGLFEVLIAVLFVIKGLERIVIPLLLVHLITTLMPLFLLTSITWSGFLIPTLEGQYIIKNVLIIAAAMGIAAHLHVLKVHHH